MITSDKTNLGAAAALLLTQLTTPSQTSYALNSLKIVAFSANPPESMRPYIVAPIFETPAGSYLVAPYNFDNHCLLAEWELNLKEFESLEGWHRGDIKAINPALQALLDHCLWIDESGQVLYQPSATVRSEYEKINKDSLAQAAKLLQEGNVTNAIDFARRACRTVLRTSGHSATSKPGFESLESDVMLSLCQERKGRKDLARFSRQSALENRHNNFSARDFMGLLRQWRRDYKCSQDADLRLQD